MTDSVWLLRRKLSAVEVGIPCTSSTKPTEKSEILLVLMRSSQLKVRLTLKVSSLPCCSFSPAELALQLPLA